MMTTGESTGTWQEVAKLTASDASGGERFGLSVTFDGEAIVVGAPDAGGDDSGAAYVFEFDSEAAWEEVAKLSASDAAAMDGFGTSVALDGDTILVGARGHDASGTDSGAAYVFERNVGGLWVEAAKLTASNATSADAFGASVAIDGSIAVVGAWGVDTAGIDSGAVYVYERDDGGVWQEVAQLVASDADTAERLGSSVAASALELVAGAPFDGDGGMQAGAAYVFEAVFSDDFEDGVLPTDWNFERGSWEESGGSLNGVPDDLVGTQIKARAIADPAFGGCDLCTVEAQLLSTNTFGGPAEIHARFLAWYADKQNNFAVTLKPAQDKVVVRQKEGGVAVARDDLDFVLEEDVTYEVKVTFDGESFHVFLDGVLLHTQASRFGTTPFGTVGVQSRNSDIGIGEIAVFP